MATNNFHEFATKIKANLDEKMKDNTRHLMFVENTSEIMEVYLKAFPAGTDPIYRERTEHDCSCCKGFLKNLGGVVEIKDGKIHSCFSVEGLPYPYDVVAEKLDEYITSQPIENFLYKVEAGFGTERNFENAESGIIEYNHFHGKLTSKYISRDIGELHGKNKTRFSVLKRSLEELKPFAIQEVIDLIESNSIYRGKEFEVSVKNFKKVSDNYVVINDPVVKDLYIWEQMSKNMHLHGIRNTVIGTLIEEISLGTELEIAVAKYESQVAPSNYKRSKSLITPKMIESAVDTLKELDLENAVNRRLAKFSDVSVNDVIFVNRKTETKMKDGLTDLLMTEAKVSKPKKNENAIKVSMEDFLSNVVSKATDIKLMVEGTHSGNFMVMTAPIDDEVGQLFKWKNNFAWAYNGNITDSNIAQRVKAAGGNITADFRVSLSWFNYDDLDLHMRTPNGHYYYGNKAGILDVDMNISPTSREAVENMAFTKIPKDGVYYVSVQNYTHRESIDVGCEIEVEFLGQKYQYSYPKILDDYGTDIIDIRIKNGQLDSIVTHDGVSGHAISHDVWGVKTNTFVSVDSIMLSPNHWEGESTGNKHYFFILEGCKTEERMRGIFNEFLHSDLDKHRKVFEVLADKTKCDITDDHIAGLGFSETIQKELSFLVDNRPYTVVIS